MSFQVNKTMRDLFIEGDDNAVDFEQVNDEIGCSISVNLHQIFHLYNCIFFNESTFKHSRFRM